MKVAVYSCLGCEKEIFSKADFGAFKFRFFSKGLAIETTCLAEGFNTIIIPSTDCLSPLVINQLHRLQIKYIIFYHPASNSAPLERAKALDMKIAYIPASQKMMATDITADNYFDSFSIAENNPPLTPEFGTLALETIHDWKKGRKNRFELF